MANKFKSSATLIPIDQAVGTILAHDITEIRSASILDLVLPKVLAGEKITRKDLAAMAHGGLCLNCDECRFPVCPFGK